MEYNCDQASRECSGRGDDYYRARAKWIKTGGPKESRDSCLALAAMYMNALVNLIECLTNLPTSNSVETDIARAIECKLQLMNEIYFCNSSRDSKTDDVPRR